MSFSPRLWLPLLFVLAQGCTSSIEKKSGTYLTKEEISRKVNALYKSGVEHMYQDKLPEALAFFEEALTLDATNGGVNHGMAQLKVKMKDKPAALHYAQVALEHGVYRFPEGDFELLTEEPDFKNILTKAEIEKEKLATPVPVVYKPKKVANGKSLLVIMNGSGESQTFLKKKYKGIADKIGAVLLIPRSTEIFSKTSFFWNYSAEEKQRVWSEVVATQEEYEISDEQTFVIGFSMGGGFAQAMISEYPDLFNGALLYSSYNSRRLRLPASKWLKVFSVFGSQEPVRMIENNKEALGRYDSLGWPFRLRIFDIGHEYPRSHEEVTLEAIKWFLEK